MCMLFFSILYLNISVIHYNQNPHSSHDGIICRVYSMLRHSQNKQSGRQQKPTLLSTMERRPTTTTSWLLCKVSERGMPRRPDQWCQRLLLKSIFFLPYIFEFKNFVKKSADAETGGKTSFFLIYKPTGPSPDACLYKRHCLLLKLYWHPHKQEIQCMTRQIAMTAVKEQFPWKDSNPRVPSGTIGPAYPMTLPDLPLSYTEIVAGEGIEPPTSSVWGWRATNCSIPQCLNGLLVSWTSRGEKRCRSVCFADADRRVKVMRLFPAPAIQIQIKM